MKLSDRILARRYAAALYLAAAGQKKEEAVAADLPRAFRALRDKAGVFHHPRVSSADKKENLSRLLGDSVSPLTLRFLGLLIDKKRFDLLAGVVGDFARIVDERKGVVHASARSAADLSASEAEAVRARLSDFSGKKVALDVKVDPELIAGLVVRMGDWVFDSSLQGRLKQLTRRLEG